MSRLFLTPHRGIDPQGEETVRSPLISITSLLFLLGSGVFWLLEPKPEKRLAIEDTSLSKCLIATPDEVLDANGALLVDLIDNHSIKTGKRRFLLPASFCFDRPWTYSIRFLPDAQMTSSGSPGVPLTIEAR